MYRLPPIIVFLLCFISIQAQSPHGDELTIDCAKCHNPSGWSINYETIQFDHNSTNFELQGAHNQTDCKQCHSSLVFNETPSECISCHDDMHNMSVGNDCMRCHTTQTWLVDNIPELHEENGFPLIGAHNNLSCVECHSSDTNLSFNRIGNECASCHTDEYLNTQNPNHQNAGFSIDCMECHNPLGIGWDTNALNHDSFYPLNGAHAAISNDCVSCHINENYINTPNTCVDCHLNDYNNTQNPNHSSANFPTDCITCHNETDWTQATFDHDGQYFPIYSGVHQPAIWANNCANCHSNSNNYADFTCYTCHFNSETNNQHSSVSGYVYESNACLQCHPTGDR